MSAPEETEIPQPVPPERQAVSLLIGGLTIAWNSTQEQVFRLFHRVSGMPKGMAEGVFFSLRSDASQREITVAVCRTTTHMGDEWKQSVTDTMNKITSKSGERNAYIHTMWDIGALFGGLVTPSKEISPERHHKLLKRDVIPHLQNLIVDTMKLYAYLELILKQWDDARASLQKQTEQPLPLEARSLADDHEKDREIPTPQSSPP